MAPSSTNKPYAEASHAGDGVPAKATSTSKVPDHITEKKANLQTMHRDGNHSPEAISNRASSGREGGGASDTYGQTLSSATATHGVGGQGKHTHPHGSGQQPAVSSSTKYPDGSTSLATHPDVPLSPSLASVDSQRLV